MGRTDPLPTDSLVGIHVLVVDDDGDSREVIRAILEYGGALVSVAASAPAGLRILGRVTPDVLISDIAMPRRDGYWLIHEVRKLPAEQGGTLPAIAITAHGDLHGPDRTRRAGYQAHLRKPVDPWELSRTVARLARRAV